MTIKTIVVSVPDAQDRRRAFESRVPAEAPAWSFFDAHQKLVQPLVYDEDGARLHKGRELSRGELGCYSSHYAVWIQLLADECDAYIILEDDVIADWRFLSALRSEELDQLNISYLRLYYKRPARTVVRQTDFVRRSTSIVEVLDPCFGTQGYYIAKPAARRFVERFSRVTRPIDDQMDRHWDHGVPVLSVFPFALVEETVPSEIGADRFRSDKMRTLQRRRFIWRDRLAKRLAVRQRLRSRSIVPVL